MKKMKSCPFCGGDAELVNYGEGKGSYAVQCKNGGFCGATMYAFAKESYLREGIHQEIKENVIIQWNKRVTL